LQGRHEADLYRISTGARARINIDPADGQPLVSAIRGSSLYGPRC
jgi:hypothetical protein